MGRNAHRIFVGLVPQTPAPAVAGPSSSQVSSTPSASIQSPAPVIANPSSTQVSPTASVPIQSPAPVLAGPSST